LACLRVVLTATTAIGGVPAAGKGPVHPSLVPGEAFACVQPPLHQVRPPCVCSHRVRPPRVHHHRVWPHMAPHVSTSAILVHCRREMREMLQIYEKQRES
jgi:hypothetical protein